MPAHFSGVHIGGWLFPVYALLLELSLLQFHHGNAQQIGSANAGSASLFQSSAIGPAWLASPLAQKMTPIPNSPYPDDEFPWNFYFNGVLMPKWGACWGFVELTRFLEPDKHWDNDVGPREIYLIECQIDHVGVPESADPDLFIYAVQEVLCILLAQREAVMESLRTSSVSCNADELYEGLVSAAIQMRRLTSEQRMAFWTSGYEADRLRLVESMEHARLPTSDPRHASPPHLRRYAGELAWRIKDQESKLHSLAQSGQFHKDLRRELHAI